MKQVRAEIDTSGMVSVEFINFRGDECLDEREKLRKILLSLGVLLEQKEIRKKTAEQIACENEALQRRDRGLRT
jgi:hypothetical protein